MGAVVDTARQTMSSSITVSTPARAAYGPTQTSWQEYGRKLTNNLITVRGHNHERVSKAIPRASVDRTSK
jgi:hypothetical protein